jgi:hypothetical protein
MQSIKKIDFSDIEKYVIDAKKVGLFFVIKLFYMDYLLMMKL